MGMKIFISYSHADHIFADAVANYLVRRDYDVWIDSRRLKPQGKWADDINEAIRIADYVISILSAESVRRPEVLRETSLALMDRSDKLIPIMIGRIHDSWYVNSRTQKVKDLKRYLREHQVIRFNGRGDITIEKMASILEVIESGSGEKNKTEDGSIIEGKGYIATNGIPELMIDSKNHKQFYKVHTDDLSPITGYPFALDNQWIPEVILSDENKRRSFEKDGFSSVELEDILRGKQKKALLVSLIHMKQLVINKSAILNSLAIRDYYINRSERKAFLSLLKDGSIVVFLYGQNDTSPFVHKMPKYETDKKMVDAWNRVCEEVPVYCIRENWGETIDQHSIDFVKFCCTIADNIEDNKILANNFGMDEIKKLSFLVVLKEVAVQGFIRTRMSGTNIYSSFQGLSRSYFYKNFITREKQSEDEQPVLNCLFDRNKPFHLELKRMVDMYYNSLFTNYFHCFPLLPPDLPKNLIFLSNMYLEHSENAISVEELEYAIAEFLQFQNVLSMIKQLGEEIYLDNWTLDKVVKLRSHSSWIDYISALEAIIKRSYIWHADFNGINELVECFISAVHSVYRSTAGSEENLSDSGKINSYSFQVSIGSDVIQFVVDDTTRRYKDYEGLFKGNQNPIQISFCLGDITCDQEEDTIFYPVLIFDGMTDFIEGSVYRDKLVQFLKDNDFSQMTV